MKDLSDYLDGEQPKVKIEAWKLLVSSGWLVWATSVITSFGSANFIAVKIRGDFIGEITAFALGFIIVFVMSRLTYAGLTLAKAKLLTAPLTVAAWVFELLMICTTFFGTISLFYSGDAADRNNVSFLNNIKEQAQHWRKKSDDHMSLAKDARAVNESGNAKREREKADYASLKADSLDRIANPVQQAGAGTQTSLYRDLAQGDTMLETILNILHIAILALLADFGHVFSIYIEFFLKFGTLRVREGMFEIVNPSATAGQSSGAGFRDREVDERMHTVMKGFAGMLGDKIRNWKGRGAAWLESKTNRSTSPTPPGQAGEKQKPDQEDSNVYSKMEIQIAGLLLLKLRKAVVYFQKWPDGSLTGMQDFMGQESRQGCGALITMLNLKKDDDPERLFTYESTHDRASKLAAVNLPCTLQDIADACSIDISRIRNHAGAVRGILD